MPPHFAQSRALAGPWSTVEQEDRLVPHRQYREGRHIRIHMPAGDDGAGGVAFAQHSFFGAPAEKVFVLLSSARLLAPADRTLIEEPDCPKSTRNTFRCSKMYSNAMRATRSEEHTSELQSLMRN